MNRRSYVGKDNPNFGKHLSEAAKKSIGQKTKIRFSDPTNHPNYKPKVEKICPICGKHFFETPKHAESRVCCSRKCYGLWRSQTFVGEKNPFFGKKHKPESSLKMSQSRKGEKNHQWQGGVSFEPYCILFNDEFRARVRVYYGHNCIECGSPPNGKQNAVHHVNYDKGVCCNGNKPLFILLCHKCNMKANKNRPWWEQYFTDMINNYYEGKCYFTKEEMKAYTGALI